MKAAILLAMALASAVTANMLNNGDFEQGPFEAVPYGWTKWGDVETLTRAASSAFIFLPTPQIYAGVYSYAEGAWNNAGEGGIYQVITVTPGRETTYSGVWAGGDWEYDDWHETGVFAGAVGSSTIAGGSGNLGYTRKDTCGAWNWQSFSMTFTPTTSQVTVYTKIGSQNGNWAPYANWFDNLSLTQVEGGVPSPDGWLTAGWNMICVPVLADDPAVASVFADLADAGNELQNSLYRYNDGAGVYELYPHDFAAVDPELGYWLHVTNPADIDVEGTLPTGPQSTPYNAGWHLLGNPFNKGIGWENLQLQSGAQTLDWQEATSAGWVDGMMFRYEPGTGYLTMGPGRDEEEMLPWLAYWLRTNIDGLTLIINEEPPGPPPQFVSADGREFYLNAEPFRFVGFNVRGLAHYGEGDLLPYSSSSDRQTNLGFMNSIGARVARIFVSAKTAGLVETGDRLAACISVAQANNVYLIVAFTDQYINSNMYPLGDEMYYTWNSGGYQMLGAEFYSYGYQDNYLPEVYYLANRFKDEPRIFAWEIGNELKYPYNQTNYVNMNHAVADQIRAVDTNHMITTGTGGLYYAQLSWSQGVSLYDGYFDFVTVHGYNGDDANDDSDLAAALDIPFIVEEAGFNSSEYSNRPDLTNADIAKWVGRGARGYLQWALMATTYDNGDGDGLFGMDRPIHWYDWDEYVTVYSYWAGAIQP